MALLRINTLSVEMPEDVIVDVALPTMTCGNPEAPESFYAHLAPYRVLWLLHGTFGDHSDWFRWTNVERYAEEYGVAVVTMSGKLSMYTDMAFGPRYETFVTGELRSLLGRMLPLSGKREENWIGGLSMGGYGSLKLALKHPDLYGGVLALSAGIDRAAMAERALADRREGVHGYSMLLDDFGDLTQVRGGSEDLFALAPACLRKAEALPKIYMACGTEDGLFADNVRFRDTLIRLGYDVGWEQGPGAHEWDFWDTYIRRGIRWAAARWGSV